jgi:hypothetical protein
MRKRLIWPLVAVCAFGVMGAESESCSTSTEDAEVESGDGGSASGQTAKVGDRVTLKGTTYRVTSAETTDSLGTNEFDTVQANGQFVVVKLTLTNRKDEPATILEDNLRLIGGNGKNYTTSTDAILAVEDSFLLEEIQPDVSQKGTLVYDLPPGAVKGAKLEVTDLFSDSKAEIKLGL